MPRQQGAVLCFLGTFPYSPADYVFNNTVKFSNKFFPLALAQAKGFDHIIVLVTEQAAAVNYDDFCAEAGSVGVSVDRIPIPLGRDEDEHWEQFRRLVEAVSRAEAPIAFDITYGLRATSVLVLLGIAYLRVATDIEVDGVYYGAFEMRDRTCTPPRVPVIDLSPATDLMDWIIGLNAFHDYGQADRLAQQLTSIQNHLQRHGQGRPIELKRFASRLYAVSRSLLGIRWDEALRVAEELADDWASDRPKGRQLRAELREYAPPLAAMVDRVIASFTQLLAGRHASTDGKSDAGTDSEARVSEQIEMVDWYATHGYIPQGFILARELIVSRLIGLSGADLRDRQSRQLISSGLNCLHRERRQHGKTEGETDAPGEEQLTPWSIVLLWGTVREYRNDVCHAAMRPNFFKLERGPRVLRSVVDRLRVLETEQTLWDETLALIRARTFPLGEDHVLLSPLGKTPGALSTALRLAEPDRVYVVTSKEGEALLPEILEKTGYPKENVHTYVVSDPFAGFGELQSVLAKMREREQDRGIGRLTVNLTGGTTVLQFIVERLGKSAFRAGISGRVVAMVDRRPYEEQRRDPYRLGELEVLEDETEADTNTDDEV